MWKNLKSSVADLSRDDILDAIGLEVRRSTAERAVPTLAVFGAGLAVGVALGLLLAPKPGRELRDDVRRRLHRERAAAEPAPAGPTPGPTTAAKPS